MTDQGAALAFAALADPTRRQIFEWVAERPQAVGQLADRLPVSRPAVSQHLKVLADAGLVQVESAGTRNLYRPDSDGVATLRDCIDSLWDVALARFKLQAEKVARQRASVQRKPRETR
jgi:DNA-binding transcriptional ArsR family regulator